MRRNLGIIIVNWNNKKEILDCLVSLKTAGYLSNVVIVDNGSTEKLQITNYPAKSGIHDAVVTHKFVNSIGTNLKILENKENLGYAEGNNAGIRYLLKKGTRY